MLNTGKVIPNKQLLLLPGIRLHFKSGKPFVGDIRIVTEEAKNADTVMFKEGARYGTPCCRCHPLMLQVSPTNTRDGLYLCHRQSQTHERPSQALLS